MSRQTQQGGVESSSKDEKVGSSTVMNMCQTWGIVTAARCNQTTVFKQPVGVKSVPREGDRTLRPIAVRCSRIRPVTDENL